MKILLSNDDGVDALGITTLADTLRAAGHDVAVVAPSEERSGQSHAMSFFRPMLVRKLGAKTWSVAGTPADCIAVAVLDLFREDPPDLVISGINHGLNVGWDVNYSGTVGAATEAALLGLRAIAVSVDLHQGDTTQGAQIRFQRAAEHVAGLLPQIQGMAWPKQEVLNVNHPGVVPAGVRIAACGGNSLYLPQVERLESQDPRWVGSAVYLIGGSQRKKYEDQSQDVALIQAGFVTLSFIQARQSSTQHTEMLAQLCRGVP